MSNREDFTVKCLCIIFLLTTLAVACGAKISWAADATPSEAQEQKEQPPAETALLASPAVPAAVGHQGTVLGQTAVPASTASGTTVQRQEQQPTTASPEARKAQEAQALFEESLRQMMPLNEGQIQEYRERSDQRERALLPVSPALNSRTVRVSLEPGRAPVKVFTTANIATSLVFHDSTGQPWPITSITNGGPNYFQVLRPELPDGNLLRAFCY